LPDALKFTEAAIRSGVSRSRLRRTKALEHELPGSRTIAMFATPRASHAGAVNAILGSDYRIR